MANQCKNKNCTAKIATGNYCRYHYIEFQALTVTANFSCVPVDEIIMRAQKKLVSRIPILSQLELTTKPTLDLTNFSELGSDHNLPLDLHRFRD